VEKLKISDVSEYESYLKLGPVEMDPLLWWKNNEGMSNLRNLLKLDQFPRIAFIAKTILAILASTASVERLFSLTGQLESDDRNALNVKSLKVLSGLKRNQKFITWLSAEKK